MIILKNEAYLYNFLDKVYKIFKKNQAQENQCFLYLDEEELVYGASYVAGKAKILLNGNQELFDSKEFKKRSYYRLSQSPFNKSFELQEINNSVYKDLSSDEELKLYEETQRIIKILNDANWEHKGTLESMNWCKLSKLSFQTKSCINDMHLKLIDEMGDCNVYKSSGEYIVLQAQRDYPKLDARVIETVCFTSSEDIYGG